MNWVVGILATLSLLNIGLLLVFLRIRNIILNEREGRVFAVVEYYSGDRVCKARGWHIVTGKH